MAPLVFFTYLKHFVETGNQMLSAIFSVLLIVPLFYYMYRWRTALSQQLSPKISAWCFTPVTQSCQPPDPSGTSSALAASGPRRGRHS